MHCDSIALTLILTTILALRGRGSRAGGADQNLAGLLAQCIRLDQYAFVVVRR
jgi:hypothetical protein